MTQPNERVFRHCASTLERSIGGRVVVYNPETDEVHALDVIGSIVWRLLDEPVTVGGLVTTLAERFSEDPATVTADVESLLGELEVAGLIEATSSQRRGPSGGSSRGSRG